VSAKPQRGAVSCEVTADTPPSAALATNLMW
jgi:hypothetical protein